MGRNIYTDLRDLRSVLYYKTFSVTNPSQMSFFENSKIHCVQDNLQKHGASWVSIS